VLKSCGQLDYKVLVLRKARSELRAWLELLRLEYQGDNFLAYFAASALGAARHPADFDAWWVALGVLDLVLAQAALELLDGYHDFHQGAHGRKDGAPVWTGGSGVLAEGRVEPRRVLAAAWSIGALACALFAVLVIGRTGMTGFSVGVLGCAAGAGWAMPPFKLSYRGVGEVLVAIVAGPLMTAQAWIVATGRLDGEAFLIGIPFGLLQFAMAMAHGIVDRESDSRAGKRTLVVRIGATLAARAHVAANLLVFASVALLIAVGAAPWPCALVLLAAPLAHSSAVSVLRAAASEHARVELARFYPPYKLLVAVGLVLAASALAGAFAVLAAAGGFLIALFALVYAPVFALLMRRWRVS
jgi:1,4-dihydroxy-2-naphthoate polyprenyltransferase